jgi:hypothetical protein
MSLPYKLLAGLLLLIGAFGSGYFAGHHVEAMAFQTYKEDIKTSVATQKAASATVTTQIVTKYVPQIQVVHEKGATIVREVKVYVPETLNARYQLPNGFVMLHDAAATGMPLPESASSVLAKPSPVAISTAASVISSNYQLCNTEHEKYKALWQWAVGQAEATQ